MADDRWFLKLDGIPGESSHVAHKAEIDVLSYSLGASQGAASPGGGGGGAGKVQFQDLHFVAKISKASPKLFLACATGTHIKEAYLSGVRSTNKAQADYLVYKMRDVMITSVQHSDGPGDLPMEQISMNYSKLEMSYFPQSSSGKVEAPVTFGFDLKANKKI